MEDKQGFSLLAVVVPVGVMLVFIISIYFAYKDAVYKSQLIPINSQNNQQETVVCTQEVKQCPDGSYVSRTGPNCEFAQCPILQRFNDQNPIPN